MNKKRAFEISYSWDDFIDSGKLNVNQKMYAQKLFEQVESSKIRDSIQQVINDVIHSKEELEAHRDKKNPFRLDIGGEG